MNRECILIIDDEPQIRKLLRLTLDAEGYKIAEASTGLEGIDQFTSVRPHLVLLDLGLPDKSGQEILKQIRSLSPVPIIILSVQNNDREKIEALDNGADDYLTKPFSTPELKARIRVALRHSRTESKIENQVIRFLDFEFDPDGKLLKKNGQVVHLTELEFRLLSLLIQHRGRILTHTQILREIWGPRQEQELQYLRMYIASLRKKIEADPANPKIIITETGIGYRFME